ncbi:MAG: methyltransferase domain-containing protein [Candidatus Kerfeldbacteria bacterium]|nr:methyltransferase domain-containing protein [Candidatus Kerfeldbacteria bacterium]
MPLPTHVLIEPRQLIDRLGVKIGMKVGDFGVGGAASFAVPLGQRVGPNGEVLMFDVLKSALSAALSLTKMRGLNNCRAVWSNLEIFEGARGVRPNSLDAGLLVNVLNQTKKYRDMLVEIHRMLKTGAALLVVDWQPGMNLSFAPTKEERLAVEHVNQVARELGFATLDQFSAGPYHWGLVLVKT